MESKTWSPLFIKLSFSCSKSWQSSRQRPGMLASSNKAVFIARSLVRMLSAMWSRTGSPASHCHKCLA